MLPSTIEFPSLTVRVHGPMHIGAGFGRGLINRAVVRGRDGLVYVPGSTLKGKVRSACEALARLHRISDCRAPHSHRMVEDRHTCLVCRIFGAPGQGSGLHWQPARLPQFWVDVLAPDSGNRPALGQVVSRTQVQLSRTRGLAAEARLFTSEFSAGGLVFESRPALIGRLLLTPITLADEPDVYYELVLLMAAVKLVGALGGSASRGGGECSLILPEDVIVDGRQIPVERQLAYVEALSLYRDEEGTVR